jgi:hypothetical protein
MALGLGVRAAPFTYAAHALAVAAAAMVLVWAIQFRGGLAIEATNKNLIFNVSTTCLSVSPPFPCCVPQLDKVIRRWLLRRRQFFLASFFSLDLFRFPFETVKVRFDVASTASVCRLLQELESEEI